MAMASVTSAALITAGMLRLLLAAGGGPMHTDSSARRTCFKSRSAVECTATVLMPSSLQARQMRKAISPRLAMTILSNICSVHLKLIGSLFDDEQGLAVFHRLPVLHQDGLDRAGLIGRDLVEHLHRLDDAKHVADVDVLAHFDKGFVAGRRGTVERADHGARDDVAAGYFRLRAFGDDRRCNGGRRGGRRRVAVGLRHHHLRAGGLAAAAYRLFAFTDFDLGHARFFEQFYQFFYFAYVHGN